MFPVASDDTWTARGGKLWSAGENWFGKLTVRIAQLWLPHDPSPGST
jgi:hypothetical protein